MASTPLARTVLDRLAATYPPAADPDKAAPMRAYMRDQFEFLGLRSTEQRALARQVLAGLAKPDEGDLRVLALACWELPHREYQYFASDLLRRHATVCSARFIDTARHLVVTKS